MCIRLPICLESNPKWVEKTTRLSCKYAPVLVSKEQTDGAIKSMQDVLKRRIKTCQKLGVIRGDTIDQCGWFSFLRSGPSHEPHLRPNSVPLIVISGGSANKIAADLKKDYSLAWHPMNVREEPIYLLVHRRDFKTYASALGDVLGRFRNMHLIGWDGGAMTGFGAARCAALAFADTLPYRPERIVMMDQDVVKTEGTRHDKPRIREKVEKMHDKGKPIVGYGVGYPTRVAEPENLTARQKFLKELEMEEVPGNPEEKPREKLKEKPMPIDFDSPAQQFVSIMAPFRKKRDDGKTVDGIYPAYMVAGGEDVLMGSQLKLTEATKDGPRNIALLGQKIIKKDLKGEPDKPNAYWSKARVKTLTELFEVEKDTQVIFNGESTNMGKLMNLFVENKWIDGPPNTEYLNVSSCVIERIILRLHKLGKFPPEEDETVFNRLKKSSK